MRFWEEKSLSALTRDEWESLCDRCARCCLVKLEDEDTEEICFTDVVCHLLDDHACECQDYAHRSTRVPTCLSLTPDNLSAIPWMPSTCAYRLLHEGQPLPDWHPLISGDPGSVHSAGISVRGKVVSEASVHEVDLPWRLIDWVEV